MTGAASTCFASVVLGIWKLSRYTKRIEDAASKVEQLECGKRKLEIDNTARQLGELQRKIPKSNNSEIKSLISKAGRQLKELSTKFNNLPCNDGSGSDCKSTNENRLVLLENRYNGYEQRLSSVESKVTRWDERMLDRAFRRTSVAKKHSPYSVTPYGKYLLTKSFGKACIDDNKEKFFALIDEQPHTTPYDIERAALGIVMDAFRTDDTNSVKNFIYNSSAEIEFNGEPHTLSTTDIQVAMAIYLRDLYMERNGAMGQIATLITPE